METNFHAQTGEILQFQIARLLISNKYGSSIKVFLNKKKGFFSVGTIIIPFYVFILTRDNLLPIVLLKNCK